MQGWIPALNQGDAGVVVKDDSEQPELRMTGWVRIGDYQGDAREGYRTKRGYYQSSVAGRAAYRQGVAQTVHATYGGVNLRTGQLLEGTAESLRGKRAQRLGKQAEETDVGFLDHLDPGEYLMPIFDGDGAVVGYDRPLARQMSLGLQKDTHMGRMLGVWAGRLFEEEAAHAYNRTLIETLHEMAEDDIAKGRGGELVNVADRKHPDPIIRDAWATMGSQIKVDAAEVFGQENYLPVRKELVNDAIGYRSASVMDLWTGQSRLPEPVRKAVKEFATLVMGEKAYGLARRSETVIQDAVSYAKTTIIVRSGVIAVQMPAALLAPL